MSKKLFPKEIIERTAEANFSKHGVRTKLIYLVVLGALVTIIIALPLINVTVSVRSSGMIRPVTERNKLVSLVSGKIEALYIKENERVTRGQIVAEISAPVLQGQYQYSLKRQKKVNRYLSDLSVLLNLNASKILTSFGINENKNESYSINPFKPFKEHILRSVNDIKQLSAQIQGNTGILLNQGSKDKLDKARNSLIADLNSSVLQNSNQSKNYQSQISSFKQSVNAHISKIKKNEADVERRQGLNKIGIVSDKKFQKSLTALNNAWSGFLSALTNKLLPSLSTPIAVQKKPVSSANYLSQVLNNQLITPKYKNSLLTFMKKVRTYGQKIEEARQKFNRQKKLFEKAVISKAAFEKVQFELESAQIEFQLLFEKQSNDWRSQQIEFENELEDLNLKEQTIEEKKDKYILRAPVTGTIQNMTGLYEGGLVTPNEPLAVISPDTGLVAEVYIPPHKIGLIQKNMNVVFQVSAYDYNQWGLLTGRVKNISSDVIMLNKSPVFKVTCTLDKTWLKLKNGYRGNLKKGMRVQARFEIAERSLFQLLHDNLDDWLNPKWDDKNVQKAGM